MRRAQPQKLDPEEQHFWIQSPLEGRTLFLRYLPAREAPGGVRVVLYVHGATFPSALSIAHPFDGRSWRDELVDAGFHVWALDFHGFGASDPYPEMADPADRHPPLGKARTASEQIQRAVHFICCHHQVPRVSIIAHSWGTIATGCFASRRPELVDRIVFFGPISRRAGKISPSPGPAWRLVSLRDQWERFTEDVPAGEAQVLSRRHFEEWGERYLDTDPESRTRSPAGVKTPSGPWEDIAAAWAGDLAYDPRRIVAPISIVRGAWDSLATDCDARWLFDALEASPAKRSVMIGRGTHLLHLEINRRALYREAETFLRGNDRSPEPAICARGGPISREGECDG